MEVFAEGRLMAEELIELRLVELELALVIGPLDVRAVEGTVELRLVLGRLVIVLVTSPLDVGVVEGAAKE